jgi:hypothetical protein
VDVHVRFEISRGWERLGALATLVGLFLEKRGISKDGGIRIFQSIQCLGSMLDNQGIKVQFPARARNLSHMLSIEIGFGAWKRRE